MRWTSDCTVGRDSAPRGFDWISCEKLLVLDALVALERMRLMTWFSTTVMMRRPPDQVGRTSENRPVAISALMPSSTLAASSRSPGRSRK